MEADLITVCVIALLAGWLSWLYFQRAREARQLESQRIAALAKLLDKCSSAEEFVAFATSDDGKRILAPKAATGTALHSILRFAQIGTVALVLGGATLWSASDLRHATDTHSLQQASERDFWGTSLVGLGAALIAAGGVSYFFARGFKMLDR
jgi:hypothetical protein